MMQNALVQADLTSTFVEYYDELYFVYEINKKYGTDYYFADTVKDCKVVSKTFYRTKELIK